MHKDGDMALISTNVCLYNILKEWKIFVQKVYCKFLCEFTAILCKQLWIMILVSIEGESEKK